MLMAAKRLMDLIIPEALAFQESLMMMKVFITIILAL